MLWSKTIYFYGRNFIVARSTPAKTEKATTPQACTNHAVFHSFLFGDIKHDAATTISHRKRIIEFLKQLNILSDTLIKLRENTYGCAEHDRCATTFYLMSMLSQEFSVMSSKLVLWIKGTLCKFHKTL